MADAIKRTPRTGWCLSGLLDVEPVACHMWAMAAMAVTRLPSWDGCAGADADRLAALCLAHDLAEAVVGDLTPHCGVPPDEKLRREQAALAGMAACLDAESGAHLVALFDEYNRQDSWEAQLAKELDRLDMCCQAVRYRLARPGCPDLAEFALSCLPKTVVPGVARRVRAAAAILCPAEVQKPVADPTLVAADELTEFARLKEAVLTPSDAASPVGLSGSWRPESVLLGCHQYMVCLMGITLPATADCLAELGGRVGAAEVVRAVGAANFRPDGGPGVVFRLQAEAPNVGASTAGPFGLALVEADPGGDRRPLDRLIADLVWLDVALGAHAAGRASEAAAAGLSGRVRSSYLRQVCEHLLLMGTDGSS